MLGPSTVYCLSSQQNSTMAKMSAYVPHIACWLEETLLLTSMSGPMETEKADTGTETCGEDCKARSRQLEECKRCHGRKRAAAVALKRKRETEADGDEADAGTSEADADDLERTRATEDPQQLRSKKRKVESADKQTPRAEETPEDKRRRKAEERAAKRERKKDKKTRAKEKAVRQKAKKERSSGPIGGCRRTTFEEKEESKGTATPDSS